MRRKIEVLIRGCVTADTFISDLSETISEVRIAAAAPVFHPDFGPHSFPNMSRCKVAVMVWVWLCAIFWFYHPWISISCQPFSPSSPVATVAVTTVPHAGAENPQHVVQSLHHCGFHPSTLLCRVYLTNQSVTCNDGSAAGYYIRKSLGSKRWIVFLEGGWYCFDIKSCNKRWNHMKNLMSSKLWPNTRNVGGILSPDPQENPHWWNANHVFVPYCSSDSWSGAAFASQPDSFSFLGSLIIDEVIKDLLPQGLSTAKHFLLAGSSAGGTGVLLNLDRVADTLRAAGATVHVRGLADSGWFLDNEPFARMDCTDFPTCSPAESIKQGIQLWNGQVPEACGRQQIPSEIWKCYFGYRIYPTLRAPLFVFQWLFDEAQLTADNVGAPISKAQWDYIHEVGDHLRRTLHNVTAVFAPSCISHIVLTKRDWRFIRVNHMSLPEALKCWDQQTVELGNALSPPQLKQLPHRYFHHPHPIHSGETYMLSDAPESHLFLRTSGNVVEPMTSMSRPKSRLTPALKNGTKSMAVRSRKTEKSGHKRRHSNKKKRNGWRRKKGRRNRAGRSVISIRADMDKDSADQLPTTCQLQLLDECTWPQCNRACPKLLNPFTGEEMDFIELLKSFGLDMSSVAMALGLDLDTLNAMGNDKLLQMLTQHSRK